MNLNKFAHKNITTIGHTNVGKFISSSRILSTFIIDYKDGNMMYYHSSYDWFRVQDYLRPLLTYDKLVIYEE